MKWERGNPARSSYSTKPVDIRTTTTTVISLTEQSLQIDVDASMGAVFFEDRKTGETLSIELTGDQLTNLANVIRNVSVT
tara:strand:+ start:186 stop:425 length:240 start_codon:yes stop_codon:yes gene_type:complete